MIRIVAVGLLVGSLFTVAGCDGSAPTPSPSATASVTGAFDSIRAADGFRVRVRPGDSSTVVVRSAGIPSDQIEVTIADGVLTLRTVSGTAPVGASLAADVTAPSLRSVTGTSGAVIRLTRGVTLSGGSVSLELSAGAEFSGEVQARDVALDLRAGSSASLSGTATQGQVTAVEASRVRAGDMDLMRASVEMSAGAIALLNVERTLAVSLTTGATLTYRGDPEITDRQVKTGATLRRE